MEREAGVLMTKQTINVDLYALMSESISRSITGYLNYRATKHCGWNLWDKRRDELGEKIADAVMGDLCEWIAFHDEEATACRCSRPQQTGDPQPPVAS